MAEKWSLLLLTLVASDLVSSQINHQSVHDQLPFSIQSIALDNGVQREADFEPIRITPYFLNDSIDASLPAEVLGPGGPLERALVLLSEALSVRRLQGNLVFKPTVTCSNETDVCATTGAGSCFCNSATAVMPPLMCADVLIPDDHIGIAETQICNATALQCESLGPNGAGLAGTDFVLYVTVLQTGLCDSNQNTYTYASACAVDPGASGTPIAGYLNVCPQNILTTDPRELKRLFTREMLHVLGFSAKLFPSYGETALGEQVYKGVSQRAVISSKVVDYARSYYACDTLGGVFLEDSTSHWDTRILLPELMTRQFYPVYSILSAFTLALLEDSGWYQANYAVANKTVNDEPIPLLYGKGLGCPFVYDDCLNAQSFPYTCSPTGSSRDWCSFDGVYKAVCEEHPATDGCRIPMPDTTVNADCRNSTANIQDSSLEIAGDQSLCFRSSFYTTSTPNQPLSDPTASCYKVHPFFDGTDRRYAVETAADTVTSVVDVDYTCSSDGEGVNATSGSTVVGGALWCGYLCNVLAIHGDAEVGAADYCHSSCKSCLRGNDPTACTSCNDNSLQVAGEPAGPCQPPEGTVRLEDGPSNDRGRVEVFTSGLWRSICVNTWSIVTANLVCAQLGYLRAEEAYLGQGGVFGQGTGPILEDLQCTGAETILQQCVFNVAVGGNCSHSMDAAVMCTQVCSGTRSSSDDLYSMNYAVNGDIITFTLQGMTTGWVGIGFSFDQLMPNSDVVVGAANSQGSFVYDGYTNNYLGPTVDDSQDIAATSAVIENGVTTVTFRRERVTNDPNDVSLDQCVYFLYAWGGTFNVDTRMVGYHHGNREPSSTMVCLPSASVCPAACVFGTYLQNGVCVVSCDNATIGDSDTRECRDILESDINSEGYTVNATKYEAALFVSESTNMVADGTILFTIGIIPVTLDISMVIEFIGAVTGSGTDNINFRADQGASIDQVVVSAQDPLPVGVYTFSIELTILNFANPDLIASHVAEAEVRILPPPQVCSPTICENSGTCSEITINNQETFSCECAPGWTGLTCAEDIDECAPEPCQNGGQCINMQNAYMCVCPSNFMGVNCEEDRDECVAFAPCQNGGNCNNTFGDYVCTCPNNWMGKNCTADVDECLSNPCQNSGSCENEVGNYSCMCTDQWTGTNCEVDVDECLGAPCENGGTCNNTDGDYMCMCLETWMGKDCEDDVNECTTSEPCVNGNCTNTDGGYSCTCDSGWTGMNCDEDINECDFFPCQNGGNCTNLQGLYNCTCPEGWTGMNCEVDINECSSDPCMNGGTCNDTDGSYNCLCTAQWTGTNCEVDVDECFQDPCQNGGTCNNTDGDYMCMCLEAWMGKDCEDDVDECTTSDPCVNGNCTNSDGGYSCTCDSGWTGMNCDEDINECDFFPCQNGGTCSNTMGSFLCTCLPVWTGSNCQTDVNECSGDPCVNGNCMNIPGNFVCICDEGWTDTLCDADVNECNLVPPRCENNGTCNNTEGSFNCICLPGFSGPTCSEDTRDPCSDMPCQNGNCSQLSSTSYVCMCDPDYTGMLECTVIDNCRNVNCGNGTCVDGVNSYMCDCDDGFEGTNCEFNIDDCDPNPCQQDAMCIDLINDYMCICPDGYSGKDCESDINLCDPNPCENLGTCNGTVSYTCECVEPFIGTNCSERQNLCEVGTCEFNGNCTSDGFTYTCNCYDSYYGISCEFFDLCTLDPCQNEGNCTRLNDTMGYICDCTYPFSGPNCTNILDPCVALEPCINGNCSSAGQGTYSCSCNPGWTGMNCDVDIMDCAMSPCVNGECMDIPGSYNCSCYQGWEGRHCNEDIDYCLPSHMCQNNATCVDGNSTYTCNCSLVDYEGSFCDVQINDCVPSPCLNNGTCFDAVRDYVCFCLEEYIGTDCSTFAGDCVEVTPCQNGGTCEFTNGRNECICPLGLTGNFCNEDINECANNPCNSGTCNNTFGSFFCSCPAGYAGILCTIINCDGNPCQNGQCMLDEAGNTNFTCICDSGYTGNLCEVDINECVSNPCGVGNCTNMQGSFTCDCPPNRTGSLCETEVDFCANVNCGNGICMNLSDTYVCVCNPGYTGANCGNNIDDCVSINCSNNGVCIDLIDDFQCMCNLGYTGPLCADTYTTCADNPCNATGTANCTDNQLNEAFTCNCRSGYMGPLCDALISHCAMMQTPCFNNGTCQDIVNGFTCDCVTGFSGNRCEFNIDECASDPCENFGTCVDGVNAFTCFCTNAWDGPTCEIYVLSGLCAALSPCANGGRCMDTVDSYECDCVGDYTGENCTVRIDHCEQNPCQGNATCVDGIQTYTCLCPPGYTGRDCDELRGTPTNCTADSDCGFGFFCQRSCPTDSYPEHDTLLKEPLTLVGESSLFVPVNRYPTLMTNSTLIARFRQDPNNAGYVFYYSSDAVTHTYGILLNASSSQVKVLYQSRSNRSRALATIESQYRWDDNAYHTVAVSVNDAGNGMFDIVAIMDGFYLGYALLDIDFLHRVGTDDPVLIVGSRLPLPGNFRFVGRIIQVAIFENALSREEVVELMIVFNHLSGVVGGCVPHLNEGDNCPMPVTAASSLCDTTTERCNPAERCLPNVLGEFECRNAPIECESDTECDRALLGPAICGGFQFPRYGRNFYERSDSRIAGLLQYLQRAPMEFDFNTPPRLIPSNEYPDVTKDLTIFALIRQEVDNNGYVIAKGSSSSNRDYGLYLASRDNFVALLYRTVNGTFHRFLFHDVAVAGMGLTTVAAIVDSERGRAELFINGTSVGRRRLEVEPQFQPQLHLLAVGGRPDNSIYNFRGTIADLLVTNVALPYDVIQSMSSAALTGQFEPSTVSRYCFMQAETGNYCHANSRADNNFRCAGNATCVVGPSAPQPPSLPQPFDQFGPIGFCQ